MNGFCKTSLSAMVVTGILLALSSSSTSLASQGPTPPPDTLSCKAAGACSNTSSNCGDCCSKSCVSNTARNCNVCS